MKFRNPETGEIFNTIFAARGKFCYGKWCADCLLPSTIKPELLPDDSGGCYEFCMKHPIEATRLMGYEVIPEPGDDTISLDTIVETFNQIGKEANMDKPLKDWTLEEVEKVCNDLKEDCTDCPFFDVNFCKVCGQPRFWDLSKKPRFTQQDIEDAKMIRAVFGKNGTVKRYDKATTEPYSTLAFNNLYINENMLPSIKEGQEYSLDEIIGSEA